jgi:glycosyltransferase involved in cell wall biosynthesis
MATPPVDVVIAAHNEAGYLEKCVDALHQQSYGAGQLSIYVVDSNSTDATSEIARRCGAIVLTERTPGAAAARNRGIRAGRADLIALLDAHCIPDLHWVSRMVERFADRRLGGCQGHIDNRAVDARIQRYLSSSGALANERVLEDTVAGKRNLYPWILSGNSMYRRRAIEEAGLFNERLAACEDVDLAWRVFLLGYQLGYEPAATVVHYDLNTWHGFVAKGRKYGAAAATLAQAYRAHGAWNKFAPPQLWTRSAERALVVGYYWLGYHAQRLKLRLNLAEPLEPQTPHPVHDEFRPASRWVHDLSMRIDPNVLFWFRDEEHTSVIVNPATRTRIVLESVADVIWRAIVDGVPRAALIATIGADYNVSSATATADLDEFVEELLADGVVRIERLA